LLEKAAAHSGLLFDYAMFEQESGAPAELVNALLRRAVERNPNLAEAQFLLGVRATDAGELESAVRHLTEAVRVEPRESPYWHALAFALSKRGEVAKAAEAARRALRTSRTAEQEGMAQALLDSYGR
jgi:tetratricopeptide (TPR) repeat protein